MPRSVPARRKKPRPSGDTAREKSARACAAHLVDLKRAHGDPPPDVPLPSRKVVRFVSSMLEASWIGSPAAACAELGE